MQIKHLYLHSNLLEELNAFYAELGFESKLLKDRLILFLSEETTLEWRHSEEGHYYHFAFNIPENKVEQVYNFLKKRVKLLPEVQTGNEIISFVDWNAHAMYFLDPAGNIVEFIARHDLNNATSSLFNIKKDLIISEIGLPSNVVKDAFETVHKKLKIDRYSGDFERFCAAGTEEGLLIITERNRNWYPTAIESVPSPLTAELSHLGIDAELNFEGGELEMTLI